MEKVRDCICLSAALPWVPFYRNRSHFSLFRLLLVRRERRQSLIDIKIRPLLISLIYICLSDEMPHKVKTTPLKWYQFLSSMIGREFHFCLKVKLLLLPWELIWIISIQNRVKSTIRYDYFIFVPFVFIAPIPHMFPEETSRTLQRVHRKNNITWLQVAHLPLE